MRNPFISVIIVAAGAGKRFGRRTPKQFVKLAGKPVLIHSLEKYAKNSLFSEIIVVAAEGWLQFASRLITKYLRLKTLPKIVAGGKSRQESVEKGLKALSPKSKYVIVHDAVRPLVAGQDISRVIKTAMKKKAAILARPVSDTLKEVKAGKIVATLHRDTAYLAETPQVFATSLLRRAFEKSRKDGYWGTDCSASVERLGIKVSVVVPQEMNLKITSREDLRLAERILRG